MERSSAIRPREPQVGGDSTIQEKQVINHQTAPPDSKKAAATTGVSSFPLLPTIPAMPEASAFLRSGSALPEGLTEDRSPGGLAWSGALLPFPRSSEKDAFYKEEPRELTVGKVSTAGCVFITRKERREEGAWEASVAPNHRETQRSR